MQFLLQEELDAGLVVPATTKELNRCQLQLKVDRQLAISNKKIFDVASGRKMSTGPRKRGDRNATRDNKRGRRDHSRGSWNCSLRKSQIQCVAYSSMSCSTCSNNGNDGGRLPINWLTAG